ncbi:hypothetical protein [Gimesia aquarii]|uniref:DUF3618 domain-containing protein n=1 Tax=Gimesia aquarii TaxID=2527964 RepID=A0A517WX31_9PLAN|nr:hypothetical protein [Gimesia aquarii]QDU09821.1 hypothetical protein V202x_32180 [Gimesia aquarii]
MSDYSKLERAEQIRQTMREIRHDLDDDVQQVKQSAHKLTSWRYYIKNHPWACVGVAAAIGYLVVPKKLNIQSLDAKTIEKLAKKNRLVVEHKPKAQAKNNLIRGAFTFLSGLALRTATAQIVQQLATTFDKPISDHTSSTFSQQEVGEENVSQFTTR